MATKQSTSVVAKQTQREIAGLIDNSRALAAKVKDDATAILVDHRILELKLKRKNIEAKFEKSKKSLREATIELNDLIKSLTDPIDESIAILKAGVNPYRAKQEEERIREQKRRQKEAEDKAKADREAALKLAKKEGDKEAIQAIKATPVYVPAVVIAKTDTPLVRQTRWYAEVKNMKTLCRAIIEGRAPEQAIEANMPYLNKRAVADKDRMDIPGVEARSKIIC